MKSSPWQFDHKPWYGWSISTILHLSLIIAVSLLLLPSGDNTSELLEIIVTFDDIGAEQVALDSITVELDSLADAVTQESDSASIFEQSDAIEIVSPYEAMARTGAVGIGGGGSSTASSNGHSGGAGQTSFFGTVAQGNSFVYILDVSPSMNAREGQRLERAVLELLQSLDQLNAKQRFYVIVFGWGTRRMFDSDLLDSEQFYPNPIPATLENKRRLREWLARIQTIPGTDPRKALEIGLDLKPSAIFFLSDGEFNKPDRGKFFGDDADEAEDVINARDPTAIPIHTVAFEDPACEVRMNGIAAITNGQHRFVPAPEDSVSTSPVFSISDEFTGVVSRFLFSDERLAASGEMTVLSDELRGR